MLKKLPSPITAAVAELRAISTKRKALPMMAELCRRAEAHLKKQRCKPQPKGEDQRPEADAQRLLHELQVHQVELEMQNADLQSARDAAESALTKFTDLYDFAPVGFFSLDKAGLILEVNLTGAAFLGVERSHLLQRPLQRFVVLASRPTFLAFLDKVFASPGKQVCEVSILDKMGDAFWVDLQAAATADPGGGHPLCRMAVSDITALKRAEEAQQRLKALAAINQELSREILQRQAAEAVLRESEQRQIQLLQESRHMQEQLRQLSHTILQAQEAERKRISRELHDDVTQTLVGINVHLENLVQEAESNPNGFKTKIARTQSLVEKAVDIVHRFARELRPPLLDDLGLSVTIESLLKDFAKQTGIHVKFEVSADVDKLNGDKRTVLYRVVQSALTNVALHSQATQVKMSLLKQANQVRLEITDNGKSFDVEKVLHARRNKRLGLIGMRERVEMVGGQFSIQSTPGKGTTIQAWVPCGSPAHRARKSTLKTANHAP